MKRNSKNQLKIFVGKVDVHYYGITTLVQAELTINVQLVWIGDPFSCMKSCRAVDCELCMKNVAASSNIK